MSVFDASDNLPDGYISYGGSSNWWIYPDGTNAGAAIACHVPLAPNGIKFGGIPIAPDKTTTIYFHCGLSTKNYGGRNTTFGSLNPGTCKAWVQVALPGLSGVDVSIFPVVVSKTLTTPEICMVLLSARVGPSCF